MVDGPALDPAGAGADRVWPGLRHSRVQPAEQIRATGDDVCRDQHHPGGQPESGERLHGRVFPGPRRVHGGGRLHRRHADPESVAGRGLPDPVSGGDSGGRHGGGADGIDRGHSLVQGSGRLSGHHHPGVPDDHQVGDREHRLHRRPARRAGDSALDHAALGVFLGGRDRLGGPQLRLFQVRPRDSVDPRG